jgi:CPA2 family monovalent cation:H+ antiporter-2
LNRLLNRGPSTAPIDAGTERSTRPPDPSHRAVIVGYGPTGRTLVDLLRANQVDPTVIELNMETARSLRDRGIAAVYGDATRPETLQAAGVTESGTLILGSAGMAASEEVIRAARALNPKIRVLARATYLRDVSALKTAGADDVFSGEEEVALAFVESILESLGATPEQIDRERDRAHRELSPA